MKQTYQGSCHCGAVNYQAQIDFEKGTTRCNCKWCSKLRYWGILIAPADFELLSGKEALHTIASPGGVGQRYYCKQCFNHPYGEGHLAELGGDFCSINVACLDLSPEALAELEVNYLDGRHDNWWQAPAVSSYL